MNEEYFGIVESLMLEAIGRELESPVVSGGL